ncbi:filamentous hemagglutinin N-terminal domain-containing protein [Dyella sp. LX-66]|uniref:MBG domain-containing protein n=1 Tax=unclassified Dyella TaxID=2634549 RepID=UPI001BDFECC5|nr:MULTISPECIES: MBG domain-containing protein [unclassified Dyella]MBT2115603.1 filamentous hemagglutinin N-terminal domain-containing protein [Dyella sp. LX-1]MBT2139418.1 filamentous hemagglutinin N-terminal domain-containing protein [Dyella sp. LX-66]
MNRFAQPVRRTLLAQMIAAAFASLPLIATAQSLPKGATVVAGNVTISQSAPNRLDIHQSSDTAITNWQSFSIGAGNTVQFVQPSASSVSLNRVVGNNPSEIYGNLVANGQVFLINGNGILFGRGAQVDAGGLVASTLNLSDRDFLAGNYAFSDPGNTRAVVNQGTLKASNGGVLALIGHQAVNLGSMQASLGSVVLGAGGTAQLTLAGNKLIRFEVQQNALGALARNGGLIDAGGGQVILTAGARDSLLASAVNNDGVIEARTVQGQSGHILLLSGMQAGTTQVAGTLDASAPGGGDGGFIETSGAHVQVADGTHITTRAAAQGRNGQWLIDPTDFTIAASGGDMTGAALTTALAGGNVVIQSTSGASSGSGDINVNDTASWSANTLTLNAQRNININAALNGSGSAGLALWYGQGAVAAGNTASYNVRAKVNLARTGSFQTRLGSDGGPINWTIVTGLGTLGDTSGTTLQGMSGNLAGYYVLGADIDASVTAGWASGFGVGFTPIGMIYGGTNGPFTGAFDGLNHVISNPTINIPGNNGTGLFSSIQNATLRNIGIVGGTFTGGSNTAGLTGVAYGNSVIDNAYATVAINGGGSGTAHVGGLVGWNEGSITHSHAGGRVTNAYQIGGLVGYLNGGSISDSYATGNVSTSITTANNDTSSSAGGLVGYVGSGSISSSYATGSVQGYSSMGGLVGKFTSGTISNAYATGNVSGGISRGGGLIGYLTGGTISNVYSTGAVTLPGPGDSLGGLVGFIAGGGINNGFYATTNAGGGAINNSGTVNAFWGGNSLGAGVTYAQLQSLSTFASWGSSIDNQGGTGSAWRIYDGYTTPLLRSFLTPLAATLQGGLGKTYDGAAASGSVSYTLSDPSASISGGSSVSYATGSKNAGTYSVANGKLAVTGNLYSNQNGYDISYVGSYVIAQKQLSGTVTTSNKVYDGTTAAAVNGSLQTAGIIAGDVVSLNTFGGSFADKNVGNGKVVNVSSALQGADAGNYLLVNTGGALTANITPKQVTVSGLAADNKTYDGTTAVSLSNWGSVNTGIAGATLTLTHGTASFASANAGNGLAVTATAYALADGSDLASNYLLTSSSAATTANITPATLIYTSNAASRTYGAANPAFNGTLAGFVNGETQATATTGSLNWMTAANSSSNVGSYAINGSGLTANHGNYIFTQAAGNASGLTVTPAALTITASDASKVYGQTPTLTGFTSSGLKNGETIGSVTESSAGTAATASVAGGPYVITAGNATGGTFNAGNYTIAYTNGSLTVTPAALTVTASDTSKIYGQTATLGGFTSTGLQNGETIGSVTQSSTGASATANVGAYAIGASNATGGSFDAGNYAISFVDGHLTVTPATLIYTADTASRTYGAANPAFSGTLTGFVNGETQATATTGSLGWATSATNTSNVGGYAVNGSGLAANNGNYIFTQAAGNTSALTVTPAALTITANDASKIYGQSPTLSGFTSSGLQNGETIGSVAESSAGTSATASVAGGPYIITAGNAAGGTFNAGNYAISYVNGSLVVVPAALTVTASDASKIYGQTPVLTGFTSSGLQNGETIGSVTESSTGASATANVGTYAIGAGNATGGTFDAGNYTIAYTSGSLTVAPAALTVTANNASKVYGQTPVLSGFTSSGLQNGETIGSVTESSAGASATANVGAYAIGASGATGGSFNAGNYTITYLDGSLAVTPATLTYTSNAASRTYGAANPAFNGTLTGFVNGETQATATTGALSWVTPATNTSNVGSYAVNGSGLAANNGNYVFTQAAGNTAALTVTPAALTVTANDASKVYGQTPTLTGFTSSGLQNGETIGSVTELSTGTSATANVGSYAVGASNATGGTFNAGNYAISYIDGSLVVTPAALTVTASNASKIYGQTPVLTGFTSSGLQNGETIGGVTESSVGTSATASVGTYAIGANNATGGTFNASNYAIAYIDGNLTVTPAALTVTANNASKVYGQTPSLSGFTSIGLQNGETIGSVTESSAGTAATASVAGGPYAITVGNATGGTFDAGNYAISYVDGSLAVTPAALTVTASNASKVYGQTPILSGFTSSGLQNGETIGSVTESSAGTSATASVDGGPYAITVSNAAGGTFDAGNYTIHYIDGSLAVTPAMLTFTAASAYRTYGDSNPLLGGSVTGFVNGENVASATTGTLAWTTPATSTSHVGSYAIDGGGLVANNGNYVFSQAEHNAYALTITPAELTVTAADASKAYGQTPTLSGFTTHGLRNGETIGSVAEKSAGTAATASVAGGPYAISASNASGGTFDAGDYTITYADGSLTVTPAALTVAATNLSKVYGQTATLGDFSSSGLQNGETIGSVTESSAGTAATASVAGGPYTITVGNASGGTFDAGNYTITYADGSLTVTPAALTVTAGNASKVYGQTPTLSAFSSSGLQNGETIGSVTETSAGTSATAGVLGGLYAIRPGNASGGTFDAGNYAITYIDGSLIVTPAALTVTAANASKVYGQAPVLNGFTSVGLLNGETIGSVAEASAGTAATASVAGGPYAITASHASGGTFDAGNYLITYLGGSLAVIPAPLTITANNATRIADGTPYAGGNGITVTGYVNGEDASVLGGTLTYGGSSQGAVTPGSYVIAPGGQTAANYALTFADGTLAIVQASQLYSYPGAQGAVAAVQSGAVGDWAARPAEARPSRALGSGLIRSVGAGVRLPAGVN